MNNEHTKVTDLPNFTKIMSLMAMEQGAMDARNLMTLANNIVNAEFYSMVKEYQLYTHQKEVYENVETWDDYCREVIKVPMSVVDKKLAELPVMIEEYEDLRMTNNFVDLLTGLRKNTRMLKELV